MWCSFEEASKHNMIGLDLVWHYRLATLLFYSYSVAIHLVSVIASSMAALSSG